MHYIASLLKYL